MEDLTASDPPYGTWMSTLQSSKPRKARDLKMNYKKARYFGQQLEDLTNDQMRSDFRTMGFDDNQVKLMMDKEEPAVDGFAQLPNYSQGFVHKDLSKRPKENVPEDRMIGKTFLHPTYKHCVVNRSKPNWVLYDDNIPVWKYGKSSLRKEFTPWMRYTPGNIRIVKYNTKSGSIGLSWVPDHFRGHTVDYTDNGPVLVPIEATATHNVRPARESTRCDLQRSARTARQAVQKYLIDDSDDDIGKNIVVQRPSKRQVRDDEDQHSSSPWLPNPPKRPRRIGRVITSPPSEFPDLDEESSDEQQNQEMSAMVWSPNE